MHLGTQEVNRNLELVKTELHVISQKSQRYSGHFGIYFYHISSFLFDVASNFWVYTLLLHALVWHKSCG